MSTARGLAFAKEQIEKTQNAFFRQAFSFELEDVSIKMNGKYKVLEIKGHQEGVSLDFAHRLYSGAYDIVKYEEMKGYAKAVSYTHLTLPTIYSV